VDPCDLTLDFAVELRRMEPFGEGNPEPVFGMRGARLSEVKPLGSDGRHLALSFADRSIPKAIWWNHGDLVDELRARSGGLYDIVFTVEISDYHERHVELRIVDLAPSGDSLSGG
jgi:single-stranded-DNA-specific exonuclease